MDRNKPLVDDKVVIVTGSVKPLAGWNMTQRDTLKVRNFGKQQLDAVSSKSMLMNTRIYHVKGYIRKEDTQAMPEEECAKLPPHLQERASDGYRNLVTTVGALPKLKPGLYAVFNGKVFYANRSLRKDFKTMAFTGDEVQGLDLNIIMPTGKMTWAARKEARDNNSDNIQR